MSGVAPSSPQVPPAPCECGSNDKKFLNIQVDMKSSSSSTEQSTTQRRDEQITTIIRQFCPFLVASVVDEGDASGDGDQEVDGNGNSNSNASNGNFLDIRPLTGGLSNHLFIVTPATAAEASLSTVNSTPKSVLVRIHPDTEIDDVYGNGDDEEDSVTANSTSSNDYKSNYFSLVDRSIENRVAVWLAEQGLAPEVYGRFKNGRVEEFYANVEPLSCPTMKDYIPQIAESMANFHSLHAPSDVLPRPAKPVSSSSSSSATLSSSIFQTVDLWLKTAHELLRITNQKRQQSPTSTLPSSNSDNNNNEIGFLDELQEEWLWLSDQLSEPPQLSTATKPDPMESLAYIFIRQVVVTHMDCQPLNILVEKFTDDDGASNSHTNDSSSKKEIRLIDFEYAGWNPRASDIGNTFCEFCEMSNLRADYENEYPTAEHQDEYFRRYCKRSLQVPIGGEGGDDIISVLSDLSNGRFDQPMIQQFIETLQRPENHPSSWKIISAALSKEVGRFSLISHLSWSIWSILKSQEDDGVPDFDYMVYARHRMDGYEWAKKKFF